MRETGGEVPSQTTSSPGSMTYRVLCKYLNRKPVNFEPYGTSELEIYARSSMFKTNPLILTPYAQSLRKTHEKRCAFVCMP